MPRLGAPAPQRTPGAILLNITVIGQMGIVQSHLGWGGTAANLSQFGRFHLSQSSHGINPWCDLQKAREQTTRREALAFIGLSAP